MDSFLETLGINPNIFNYVILPILIFSARIFDVSIATLRIIFVMSGKKFLAPVFGFFESLIWLIAIGQIFQNVDNVYSYVAFSGGFAAGTLVGMLIEEKLALGNVVLRVITRKEATELIDVFRGKNFHFSNIVGEGRDGKVNVLFAVIKRKELKKIVAIVQQFNPNAFYTVESVKKVSSEGLAKDRSSAPQRFLHLKRR